MVEQISRQLSKKQDMVVPVLPNKVEGNEQEQLEAL